MKNYTMHLFVLVMSAHWMEHIVQAYQVYVLRMPRKCAMGVLGMRYPWLVTTEVMHLGFAVLTLAGIWMLRRSFQRQASTLWDGALYVSIWHLSEHASLFVQAQTNHYLWGSHVPISVLTQVTGIPRIEVHLFYNSVVTVLCLTAMVLQYRQTRAIQLADTSYFERMGIRIDH